MSNIRTELETIPSEYVLEYTSKLDDVSTLKIEIPNTVKRGEREIKYPLYDKVQGKQFIVVKKDGEPVERFVIDGISESITKGVSTKTINANSYDSTLKSKTCLINEGMTRQLYKPKDETFDVEDGILNIFEEQTGWTVVHVDEMARKEVIEENVTVTLDINTPQIYEEVADDTVLFDKDVDVPSEEDFALNLDISWLNLVITTTGGAEYEAGSIVHTFVDLPNGVKHIKATFTSNVEERYGMTYELTLTDDTVHKVTYAFVNCRNVRLAVDGMKLTYVTSTVEEKTVAKYRFLEHQSSYWYNYLKTTIQEAYGCYIFFDSYNKTVSVYDKPTRGEWKGFYLDFDNLLTKITKTPKVEDICTRLWIESNNVDITEVNPLGTSYLEDYSYFRENGSMSESLAEALDRYYAHVETIQIQWNVLKDEKNATDQLLVKRNSELISLNEQIKTKNAFLTAYIKENSTHNQERVANELIALEEQLATLTSAITELQARSDELLANMQELGRQMSKEFATDSVGKIFTELDLEEIEDFTIEQTYTDDCHTKAKSLYAYAQELMKDKARLKYTFSLEHGDLVKGIKHPLGWQWFIELGAKVELNDKDIADADGFVTIYAYTYSPKNQTISSVDFNNNSAIVEAVSGLASIGKLVHQTASMTDYWKHTWGDAANATAIVSDIRKNGLDLAANIVRGGSTVNKVSMSEAGLFVIDANNENNQIYIGASLIAITDDKWIHSKTAIDTGGVIADTLVGRLILGEQLFISNEDNSFSILPDGLIIRDKYGIERVSMGVDANSKNPYLHLGNKNDKNYLLFNEDGSLDIKASSLKLTVGDLVTKDDVDNAVNEAINDRLNSGRNYALNTVQGVTVQGDGSSTQVFKLYNLSQEGSVFVEKKVATSFNWEYSKGTSASTFFVRTGGNHNQQLSETITVSGTENKGKASHVTDIVEGDNFSDIELVVHDLQGEITITLFKFEIGDKSTVWSAAPEDGEEAYTILLSNEAQVIATDSNSVPFKNETFETEVLIYQGSFQKTEFTIDVPTASDGITPSVDGNIVKFSVNDSTPIENTSGRFDIDITVDGKKFKKVWTWAIAKQNTEGHISITGDQVFRYTNNFNSTPTPSSLKLTANKYNMDEDGIWQYKDTQGAWVDWIVNGAVLTDTNLTINPNDGAYSDSSVKTMQVRYIINNTFDEFTTYKVSDGSNGESGVSITDIQEQYYISESQQTLIGGVWTTVAPSWEKGKFIWTKTVFIYSDGSVTETMPICVTGKDGADGLNGGVSVSGVDVFYYQSDSATELIGGTWSTTAPQWVNGKYVWSKTVTYLSNGTQEETNAICITGERGQDGVDGVDGTDGTSYYFYVRYSANADGCNMTMTPQPDTQYIGVCSTTLQTAPTDYRDYEWSLIKGDKGENGTPGAKGEDGRTSYLHIKYSNDGGKTFTSNNGEDLGDWIGTYVDFTEQDSSDVNRYAWKKFVGENGQDGRTSYFHIKYSNDGGKTFTANNGEELGTWIGTYVDFTEQDSNNISRYLWKKYVGEDGKDGTSVNILGSYTQEEWDRVMQSLIPQAQRGDAYLVEGDLYVYDGIRFVNCGTIKGESGEDGKSSYIHIKYSNDGGKTFTANDGEEMGDWMGTYVDFIQSDSLDVTRYNWKKIVGEDGLPGKDAAMVAVTGEQVFKYSDNFTSAPTPSTITLKATKINTNVNGKWQYMSTGGTWTDWTENGTVQIGVELTVTPTSYTLSSAKTMRVRYYINSTIFDEITIAKISDGVNGESGYTVLLTNENHTFQASSSGKIASDTTVTSNVMAYRGASIANFTYGTISAPSGMTISTSGSTITFVAKAGVALANSGTVNIPIIIEGKTFTKTFSWSKALQGAQGLDGASGADAYTVLLTNENHIFNADSDGNITSAITTTTDVVAYKGATSVTPTIGTLPSVSGLTLSKSGTTVTIKANTGTALASNGKFNIPITVDGKSFTKSFSWAKMNKGANAYGVSIGATSQVFKSTDGGQTYTPDNIVLTPILQNLSFSKWQYSTNGGSSFTDVSSGSNGLTVSSGKLTVAKTSNLFTSTITSIVFKLVTNNTSYYDTVTIVKLNDVGDIEIGGRNYIRDYKFKKDNVWKKNRPSEIEINTVEGYGALLASTANPWLYQIMPSDVFKEGQKVTVQYEIKCEGVTQNTGADSMVIRAQLTGYENDSGGYVKDVCILSREESEASTLTSWTKRTCTGVIGSLGESQSIRFRLYARNFTGKIYFRNVKLELGNKATDLTPAPEDGTDYTDELIAELRTEDIAELIKQNQNSSNRIDEILSDTIITPNEKVDLQYEFERVKKMKEAAQGFYDAVNNPSMFALLSAMNTAYDSLDTALEPVLSDMTTNSKASNSALKNNFKTFYECYEDLLTALQQSVAILSIKNSTTIEAMETKIAMTASTTEVMADKVNEMRSHLDFTREGFVEIYATTNGVRGRFSTQITDQKLAFKDDGTEVAYISNQELFITKATITDQMQISNFIIKPSGTVGGGVIFVHKDNA